MSDVKIVLDDVEFNTGVADERGAKWWITNISGWEGAPTRQDTQEMTNRHGAVQSHHMLDPRGITLGGVVTTRSATGYWEVYNKLIALGSRMYDDVNLVVHETHPKRLRVRCGAQVRIDQPNGSSAVTFEMTLIALDPLKYATAPTTVTILPGATTIVSNLGNFATEPVVEVHSGTFGLRNNTDAQKEVGATVGNCVANFRKRDYKRTTGGNQAQNRLGLMTKATRWWALVPGDNELVNTGTASVKVTFHSAWL